MSKNKTRQAQERIYRNLYEKYQGTPMAVSSESLAHKALRFEQLCGIFANDNASISVHDIGMGIADLYTYIEKHFPNKKICYSGSEILKEYVAHVKDNFSDIMVYHRDIAETAFDDRYDYLLMSGIFHQRQDTPIREWEAFSQQIIRNAFEMCSKGIAFNFISPFVDFYQTQVYYSNLPKLLNFINDHLSRFFEIKHNYALYEFTVYVYREAYIHSKYPETEFQKYFKS